MNSNKEEINNNLKSFLLIPKFKEDTSIFYSGLSDNENFEKVNELINISINEFIDKIKTDASESDLQLTIKIGLDRFNDLYLDTEDRERVCMYYQEIMDIINLESSNGIINEWLYGFDV